MEQSGPVQPSNETASPQLAIAAWIAAQLPPVETPEKAKERALLVHDLWITIHHGRRGTK